MLTKKKVKKAKPKKCRTDGCTGIAKWRGLCVRCYRTAWRHVNKIGSTTTWADLEKRGLAEERNHSRCTPILAKLRAAN